MLLGALENPGDRPALSGPDLQRMHIERDLIVSGLNDADERFTEGARLEEDELVGYALRHLRAHA